jgi:hypothetical protein
MTAAIAANSEISTPALGNQGGDENARTAADATEFISFAVGDEQYGVNIMAVREIKDWSVITRRAHRVFVGPRRRRKNDDRADRSQIPTLVANRRPLSNPSQIMTLPDAQNAHRGATAPN